MLRRAKGMLVVRLWPELNAGPERRGRQVSGDTVVARKSNDRTLRVALSSNLRYAGRFANVNHEIANDIVKPVPFSVRVVRRSGKQSFPHLRMAIQAMIQAIHTLGRS